MERIYLDTLLLLADSLNNRISTHINADNWPEVFAELQAHAVTSLIAKNMVSLDLPSEEKLRFMQILALSFRNYNNIVLEQDKILTSLREVGVDVAVLKGTSAAKYYPNPEYRAMGDIDILVNPKDFNKARSVINSLAFIPIPDEDDNERHIGFHNAYGLEIELHRHFSDVGTKKQRDYLDNRLYSVLNSCENSVLPEVENGLVLIGHVAQHLKSGLGLRQIIDWMMFAKDNLTDEFWNTEFSVHAMNCGFDTLAKVTTAMCCKYLGLELNISWCSDVDETVVQSLMEYIMSQGNFGRKRDVKERNLTTGFNHIRNPIAFMMYLQQVGKKHWKLARTNSFFGCFAWLYQIGHIIKKGINNRIGLKKLKNSIDESNSIVYLMNELKIKNY